MSTPKLNQIIAIEKGLKERVLREITDMHHIGQKADFFNGLIRTYTPKNDDGEIFPPESKIVQQRAAHLVEQAMEKLNELFDITATKDFANSQATANLEIDGQILATNLPVTYFLFLEQYLIHIKTFVDKLPSLSTDEEWTFDPNLNVHKTKAVKSVKTAKIQEPVVLLQPTTEHPGKAELITKDVVIGSWETVKISGALTVSQKTILLDRIQRLQQAVKFAREKANMTEAPKQEIGAKILSWITSTL